MVEFARLPWPSTLIPLFMPMARVPGPLHTMTGPTGIVVASTPCMLKVSLHTASSAAMTHGMYSGRQPAMTALMAIFSTVSSTRSGGQSATMSPGARVVPVSIRRTRSRVGGTTGRPSVQPRANIASNSSSAAENSTRRAVTVSPVNRARNLSTMSGSTLMEPQPGRITGRSSPRSAMPVSRRQSSRDQPNVRPVSLPSRTVMSVGTVSMLLCHDTARSESWIAPTDDANAGSSWVHTVSGPASDLMRASSGSTSWHVAHSFLTTTTRPSGRRGAAVPMAAP